MAATITAELVKKLREQTGAGMMECKRVLVETNGDLEKASEIIAKAGHRKAEKKADRTAAEGMVSCKLSSDGKQGVIVEINCETDFVARDEGFKQFCNQVGDLALSQKVATLEELKALSYRDGLTVEEARQGLVSKIGENINIRRIQFASTDTGLIGGYSHGSKIGVLVLLEGGNATFAKELAMHIAASRPQCIHAKEVPAELVERETRIATERAQESGKPEAIIEKMVSGQVQKYLNEICLMGQPFVKDLDQTVEKVLKANQAEIKAFYRYEVGEGIEIAPKMSFQEEVMSVARGQ
jgi:elongation factor Ts